jgi:dipeptidase D
MDMVTDATPDRKIDFNTDPITTFRDGDWLKADRTTLGADNGIGCAAALALMHDETIEHPPLELLFTVDEETGLVGAWGVNSDKLSGKKMLNLDTEEWGSLYIGCAGGIDYEFNKSAALIPASVKGTSVKLVVGGFLGGHSGVDIHEQRGNAIKFLVDWLQNLPEGSFELSEWRGGKAHNIIPRDAFAKIIISDMKIAEAAAEKVKMRWMNYMPESDRKFFAKVEKLEDNIDEVLNHQDQKALLNFLTVFPHGAHAYDLPSEKELVSLKSMLFSSK